MSKVLLIIAFCAIFVFLGVTAMKEGMVPPKNERVYTILKKYIPYKLEKRVGGYKILSTQTDVKEEPRASQVFHRLDQLEQQWGDEHLRLEGEMLRILNKDKKVISTIQLQTKDELDWVKTFFKK